MWVICNFGGGYPEQLPAGHSPPGWVVPNPANYSYAGILLSFYACNLSENMQVTVPDFKLVWCGRTVARKITGRCPSRFAQSCLVINFASHLKDYEAVFVRLHPGFCPRSLTQTCLRPFTTTLNVKNIIYLLPWQQLFSLNMLKTSSSSCNARLSAWLNWF